MHDSRIGLGVSIVCALGLITACASQPAGGPTTTQAARHEMVSDDYHAPLSIEDVRGVMQAKLAHTQALFEGLVMEDMTQMAKNADELRALAESTAFRPHRTVTYGVLSDEFADLAARLARDAHNNDFESAHRNYVRLTDACIRCHTYIRAEHLNLDLPGAVSLARPASR